jgi:hypothetical protein
MPFVGQALDNLVLTLEITVDRAGTQLCFADDVFYARAREAPAREACNRGIENLTPSVVPMGRLLLAPFDSRISDCCYRNVIEFVSAQLILRGTHETRSIFHRSKVFSELQSPLVQIPW